MLPDGSILVSREPKWSGYPPTGMQRNEMEFFLLEGDGVPRAEIGSHPGAEEFYYLDETVFPPFSFWMLDPPFQQTVVWGAWDGLAIVSPSDRYEIRAYGPEGTLRRIVRRDHCGWSTCRCGSWRGRIEGELVPNSPHCKLDITFCNVGITCLVERSGLNAGGFLPGVVRYAEIGNVTVTGCANRAERVPFRRAASSSRGRSADTPIVRASASRRG